MLERAAAVGGKMRRVPAGAVDVDGGPTVFTMRWVFEKLFSDNGFDFATEVPHRPAELLARHAWERDETLDLFVDVERSAEAVAAFSGPAEAARWRDFIAHARRVFETLNGPFLENSRPDPISLTTRMGLAGLPRLFALQPFATLQRALEGRLTDPRLIQLYGRYATYCGSSPYLATAMLAIVAHVEQVGVWYVEGGMHRLAQGLARTAERLGATIRTGVHVVEIVVGGSGVAGVRTSDGETIDAAVVVCNADANALASGLFGRAAARAVAPTPPARRSLSALVWTGLAEPRGFALARHNVFFSGITRTSSGASSRPGPCPRIRPSTSARRTAATRRSVPAGRSGCSSSSTPRGRRPPCLHATGDRAMPGPDRSTIGPMRTEPRLGAVANDDHRAEPVRGPVPGDGGSAVRPGVARLDGVVPEAGRAHADPGPLSRGGQRAPGAGGADGRALGPARSAGGGLGARFDQRFRRWLCLVVRRTA